ncbi:hypothetical protein B0T14DRAFT_605780 [Immersiella caudata]|uniref:F-box domain-containing protein n=1 Tax=Immersiella caudata TaxID=314043 RepID=A0AA39WBU9_9PEZI|nr:hypothetical protein B0T14DRAFT_605780 [Immersiella caudata]
MGFDTVPREIVDQICESVSAPTLRSLRLVCRRLEAIASSHVFRHVLARASKSSIENFSAIANHPVHSQHVRYLFYTAGCIFRYHHFRPLAVDEYLERWRVVEYSLTIDHQRGYYSVGSPRLEPSQHRANHEVYMAAWEDHEHVVHGKHDVDLLTELLPNSQTSLASQCRINQYHRFGIRLAATPKSLAGLRLRRVKAITDAIVANSIHPTWFCHSCIHHYFFDPHINTTIHDLILLLDNLAYFEIASRMSKNKSPFHFDTCRTSLRQRALWTMIAAMPNLEVLSLPFNGPHRIEKYPVRHYVTFEADLHHVIPPHSVIPKLKRLCLAGMEARLDELLGLYKWHRATLKTFELATIGLVDGLWYDLLPPLKGALAQDTLPEIFFRGHIFRREKERGMEMWRFDDR